MFSSNFLVLCILFCLSSLLINGNDTLPPKLLPVLSDRVLKENSIFQIYCSVQEGSQPFFFEWQRNGQSLKSGPDFSYKIDTSDISSTLTIRKIKTSDAGNYTCTVKNAHGVDSQYSLLTIRGKLINFIQTFFRLLFHTH